MSEKIKKLITLSGVPGTGTTTIANLLQKKLNLPLINTGELFRELAIERNMDLAKFSIHTKSNPEIDYELDKRQVDHARRGDIILEGRLSGWMIKSNNIKALKVLLTADLETRISRIMGREGKSYKQVKAEIEEREACELERYQKLYGINYQDPSHYDLIIDTINLTPDQILEKIIIEFEKFLTTIGE